MNNTFEKLKTILIREYHLTPDLVTPEATLEELNIDSLGIAELLFNVEDEFQIALPPEPAQLLNVGDVVRYIDALVVAQHARVLQPHTDATPGAVVS
jgi:acyl carrier protein